MRPNTRRRTRVERKPERAVKRARPVPLSADEAVQTGAAVLALDAETAPALGYFWGLFDQTIGINQLVQPGYVLCVAAQWLGEDRVMYARRTSGGAKGDSTAMLHTVHKWIDSADAVVGWNSQKFDIPTLNAEFIQAGLRPPSPVKHVDLMRTVKARFKFPSYKLEYVAPKLGAGEKISTGGFELWRGVMDDDAESWRLMREYCEQDVRLLSPLYRTLRPWLKSHPSASLAASDAVCPTCGSPHHEEAGTFSTGVSVYPRYRCTSCGAWFRGRARLPEHTAPMIQLGG